MSNKVFFLIDYFKDPYAGTEGQVYALINGLLNQGTDVQMAVLRPSDYVLTQNLPCPVRILDIQKMLSIKALVQLVMLAAFLKKNDFKFVHIYFNDASVIAPFILKIFGIKTIISRRDMGFWYTPAVIKILKFNAHFIEACICNSHAVKQLTMDTEHISSSKVHVVYNGLPEAKKIPSDSVADGELDALIQGKQVIGLVANIRPIKRIADLIYAIADIASRNTFDVVALIIGAGDQGELKALCKTLNIEHRVYFLGSKKNVAQYINKFDVAVLSSESEGLSNAIIEYMAAGLPVVCSDVGGNSELIEHEVNGYLYSVGDVKKMAFLIEKLLEKPEIRQAFGSYSMKVVREKFSMDSMIRNTLNTYQSLGVW